MDAQSQRIEFLVQGSASEPYRVAFWRVTDNVKSSCTCQAGKNGLACKHRVSLLEGDVTNLVSQHDDSLEKLQMMLESSDVGAALRALNNVTPLFHTLENLLHLKPPGRRKSVAQAILCQSVTNGGLIKGNQSNYDVFSADLSYIGSVKVRRGTVFSETPINYFPGLALTVRRLTDGLVWEKSQSVYAAAVESPMSVTLEGGVAKTSQQQNLKRALRE
jgi:hypothetical protein